MIKKILNAFEQIDNKLENDLVDISVKQSQIMFGFGNSILFKDLNAINSLKNSISITDIVSFQDLLFVRLENLSEDLVDKNSDNSIDTLYSFIFSLAETLCSCPVLEYSVAGSYLKIYLDLPNITSKNLRELDFLLNSEGVLELGGQRPYVLYVRDW